jgi:hypothetical protein
MTAIDTRLKTNSRKVLTIDSRWLLMCRFSGGDVRPNPTHVAEDSLGGIHSGLAATRGSKEFRRSLSGGRRLDYRLSCAGVP